MCKEESLSEIILKWVPEANPWPEAGRAFARTNTTLREVI